MGVSNALRKLARFLEECESRRKVNSVELDPVGAGGDRTVTAEIDVTLAISPDGEGEQLSLVSTSVDDGRLGCEFRSVESVVPTGDGAIEVEPSSATLDTDGTIDVTLSASVPTGEGAVGVTHGPDGTETVDVETGNSGDPGPAVSSTDREVPPFRDPDLLSEVYESCDTFAEMSDALDMDVTAETVRRYMIDYDIHQPSSYDTDHTGDGEDLHGADPREERVDGDRADAGASDGRPEVGAAAPGTDDAAQTPVVLPDGIGLPDDVTVESLVETVDQSNTIYEFKRDIGVDREDALEMLRELNLLDLLVGRIATEAERDIEREEIVERLREASAQQ